MPEVEFNTFSRKKGADYMFTMTEEQRLLSNALLLLAEFYKPPTNELYQALRNGTALEELKPFVKLEESYEDAFSSYENMKQTYIHCFLGPSEPFAPPIESLYKQWTDDPTAAVSFARQTGFFYGDPALHVQYLFRQFKLEFPAEYRAMPDHLTLLLEFLSYLLEHGTAEQIRSFISDHFDWLDDFVQELKKADNSLFYVSITQILNKLVHSSALGHRSEQLCEERSE